MKKDMGAVDLKNCPHLFASISPDIVYFYAKWSEKIPLFNLKNKIKI
jgi:hypothetical protein